MSEKYIVFGATGSIGSSLAEQLVSSGNNVHLVARNEAELKNISDNNQNNPGSNNLKDKWELFFLK